MKKVNNRQSGLGLIEVLVAALVFALGIAAVFQLQGKLFQSSSSANARTIAMTLAEERLEIFRQTAAAPDGIGNVGDGTDSLTVGNTSFTRVWAVTDYYYDPTDGRLCSPLPLGVDSNGIACAQAAGADPEPELVGVEIIVSWVEIDGNNASVVLDGMIGRGTLASAAGILAGDPDAGGSNSPMVPYTPEGAPDVIDIAVDTGRGTQRQTSKPLPDVVQTGPSGNTIVSFDVMTYESREGSTGDFLATRQEEFFTVDCNCELAAAVDGVQTMTPAHAVWDDVSKTRFDVKGTLISKQTAIEVNNANDAEELCAVCCRDHHDTSGSPVKYVPGTTSGNHVHYKADGTGPAGPGDVYTESCRLKRVDGFLSVYPDWNLVDITILDREQLFDGQALQQAYQEYVENLILFEVVGEGFAEKPSGRLLLSLNQEGRSQLESRGLYIDEVYDLEGNVSADYLSYVGDTTNLDRLEKVPFSEVNLTLLSNWSSAQPASVSVTNDGVATIADPANAYYGTYSRGYIDAILQTAGVDITTTIRTNNDGLTQLATPPFAEDAKAKDTISVVVAAAGDAFTVSGTYGITFPLGKSNPLTVSAILMPEGSGSCIFPGKPGNTYTCSLNAPWTGSLKINAEVKNSCSGESAAFQDGGANDSVTHDFASFACD